MFNDAVDLAAEFELARGGLGRLMRLAKDWEFVEIWSSGRYLERWEAVEALLLRESVPVVRKDEYDAGFPIVAERPVNDLAGPSFTAPVRDAARRGSTGGGWPAFCSNLFFMSLTVPPLVAAIGTALPVAECNLVPSLLSANLSSTGLEAERWEGLAAVRLPGTIGGFEEVALLAERTGGVGRLLETTEAIEMWVAEEATRPCGSETGDW